MGRRTPWCNVLVVGDYEPLHRAVTAVTPLTLCCLRCLFVSTVSYKLIIIIFFMNDKLDRLVFANMGQGQVQMLVL